MEEWNESRLIFGLKQGQDAAYQAMIRQYQKIVFKTAYGVTLNRTEAEDIVQEVFIKVFKYIGSFREDSSFSTWLYRITVNHCLNWKRKMMRRFARFHHSVESIEEETGEELKSEMDGTEEAYDEKEMQSLIQEGLKRLPEDARTVFVLKELEGLSYEEIADILLIKTGTVSSRLFYARQKLNNFLARRT